MVKWIILILTWISMIPVLLVSYVSLFLFWAAANDYTFMITPVAWSLLFLTIFLILYKFKKIHVLYKILICLVVSPILTELLIGFILHLFGIDIIIA